MVQQSGCLHLDMLLVSSFGVGLLGGFLYAMWEGLSVLLWFSVFVFIWVSGIVIVVWWQSCHVVLLRFPFLRNCGLYKPSVSTIGGWSFCSSAQFLLVG
jgi:hypothetical protein